MIEEVVVDVVGGIISVIHFLLDQFFCWQFFEEFFGRVRTASGVAVISGFSAPWWIASEGVFLGDFSACRRLRGWSAALISSLCPTVLTKLILAHIYCRVCHTTGHWNDWRVSGSVEPKVYCLVSANEARLCVYIRVFGCFLMLVTVLDVMKRRVWPFVSGVVVITWWAV